MSPTVGRYACPHKPVLPNEHEVPCMSVTPSNMIRSREEHDDRLRRPRTVLHTAVEYSNASYRKHL